MESFEKGTKTKKGLISVIDLWGTWREMGRQYGALMTDELAFMYGEGIINGIFKRRTNVEVLKDKAVKFAAHFPYRFREVLKGIAETSGLSLEAVKLTNALELLYAFATNGPRCTGIAVWGDYSSGPLVYGRNYDYFPLFKKFKDTITIAVYHPADGSLAAAVIGYVGGIYAVNGMNERGIFLELNNGMPSGGALWYDSRVPSVAKLFEFLLDSETLDDIESLFQTTKSNFAYVVGVADGQTARCYEWPVFEVRRRESHTRPGLTVLSNHFTEPSWGLPRPDDKSFWMTRTRRQNLLNLATHLKGTIDSGTMMKIMDTRIEDLGATTDMTLYQLVAVPEKLELWIKIPNGQDWTEIDMGAYLRSRPMVK